MTDVLSRPTVAGGGAEPSSSTGHRAAPAPPAVAVVLVVRNGAAWLTQCLDGIAAQTIAPAQLLVVDVASTDTSVAIAQAHRGVRRVVQDVQVLRLPNVVPVGQAIDAGVANLPSRPDARGEWVWVLHDDTVARPTTLARLLEAVLRSRTVAVAGPKIVSWDDPRRLVELGIQVTRSGRRLASPAPGEIDQGQYDSREDVLAVSTSGMLVRRDAHEELGGFDPTFDDYGADLDFGWRAQLADRRVIVVPGAVIREASAGMRGERPDGPRPREVERRTRRASRQVALARCGPVVAPFLAIWMAVSSLVSSLTLLVAKRPRLAWRELTDVTAVAHPAATLGARWRGRRTKRLRRGDLDTLFVSPATAARTTVDHIQDAIVPEHSRQRREAGSTTETGPTSDDSDALGHLPASLPHRVATHPGFLAVMAVLAATAVAWRVPIRAGALSGGNVGLAGAELRAVATGSSGLWHAFRDGWHGAGLGTSAESGPYLAVLSGLTWLIEHVPGVAESRSSAGVTIAWLLFLTPALSAWTAYVAGRVVTRSRLARALVAVAWGAGAVVTGLVGQGRVTAAVAHIVIPLVLAGFTLAARRDGTWTATFATVLAVAVLGAFVPPLIVGCAVAALVLVLVGPGVGRRLRGLALLVVPVGLLGPWVVRFVDDWRLLLSGPGIVSTSPEPAIWSLLAGQPEGLPTAGGRALVVALALVPVLLLGLVGLATPVRSRRAAVGLVAAGLLSLVGLAAALASGRVVLGSAETGVGASAPAHLWAGVGLELWVAGLLVGVLVGSTVVLPSLRRPRNRWALTGAVTAAALLVAPVLLLAADWAVVGVGRQITVGQATLPAVAVEQGGDPLGNRLLLLRPSDRVVDFVLVGQEPGELLRDLDRNNDVDESPLVTAVAEIVGGRGQGSLDAAGLASLGIGFVQAAAPVESPLARRLDSAGGLSRLGASQGGILWKVQPLPGAAGVAGGTAPSRVRLVDGAGAQLGVVPTSGPHAAVDTSLPAGAAGRRVVVAEPAEWAGQAVVSFDGQVLAPLAGETLPTYAVPARAGALRIDLAAADPWWRLAQGVLLALVVFLAVPFGNRRSRRRA